MQLSDDLTIKQRILSVAAECFLENGVSDTSLAGIASRASISKGTLYYHYSTKAALVNDVCELHYSFAIDMLYNWIESVAEYSDVDDALKALALELYSSDLSSRLHVALLIAAASGEPSLRALVVSKHDELAMLLEVGLLRMRRMESIDKYLAKSFIAMVDGYLLGRALGTIKCERKEYFCAYSANAAWRA